VERREGEEGKVGMWEMMGKVVPIFLKLLDPPLRWVFIPVANMQINRTS